MVEPLKMIATIIGVAIGIGLAVIAMIPLLATIAYWWFRLWGMA